MRFSHDYSKLQDRLFTTVRGHNGYMEGQTIWVEAPSSRFRAKVLLKVPMKFKEIPEPFLQYDTDSPGLPSDEIIKSIQKLYYRDPPEANDVVTVYLLEKLEA